MLKTTIIGASGYTGAELALMVEKHPELTLAGLYVSANSSDAGKCISQLHGKLAGVIEMPVLPLTDPLGVAQDSDVIFLATAHEVSHDLAPLFLQQGCQVFDLSGAFRVKGDDLYTQFTVLHTSTVSGWTKRHMVWLSGMKKPLKPVNWWRSQGVTPQRHSWRLSRCWPLS